MPESIPLPALREPENSPWIELIFLALGISIIVGHYVVSYVFDRGIHWMASLVIASLAALLSAIGVLI